MHVISRKRINEFVAVHGDARSALVAWYAIVSRTRFGSFAEVRRTFPSADQVGNKVVFNIGGNKYRLIAAVHFNREKVYIREILTHAEYDRGGWKR
ncbi:MAG: type II toxin-antitoxin system HigB family toxin [Candidatus Coatesbacteria bacterium]